MGQDARREATHKGVEVPVQAQVLHDPEEFDVGLNGHYQEWAAQEYARQLVDPVWYVLRDDVAEPVCGVGPQGGGGRALTARVGFNPEQHTQLYVTGLIKDQVPTPIARDHPTRGNIEQYGRRVWGWQLHAPAAVYEIAVYRDERGFFWTIEQDVDHVAVGLGQRHGTRVRALAAAVDHLIEDGVPGLIPIQRD